MKGTSTLNITQYNVNRSKDRVQQHFLQLLDPLKHHVVALQEPWHNPTDNTTLKHPAYHLVFPGDHKSRTCIYISKHLATNTWRKENVPEESNGDITSISLETDIGKVWVHNIYNPPPLSHSSRDMNTLRWIPEILEKEGYHILVGDFNIHHVSWGGQAVTVQHKIADSFNDILSDQKMELILPKGTITWMSRGSQSTLDLVFVSKELEGSVLECRPANELEASSDHIPICTKLNLKAVEEVKRQPRLQWKKADWENTNARLAGKLRELRFGQYQPSSQQTIDEQATAITHAIQETMEETIPKSRPSPFAKPYWTKECSEAVKETRRARRQYTMYQTEESWIEYRKASNRKKNTIKKAKNIGWRAVVSEATSDPSKLWKLTKWAKKTPDALNRLPQIPDIKDSDDVIHTKDADKVKVMAQHFFPAPVQADIRDINGTHYPPAIDTISMTVTENEVVKTLGQLANEKAPGPDRIPNWMLKNCRKTLAKVLTDFFNSCLSTGYHPASFKESLTIVLRKPQKPSYDTPKAYRPIALLNTIGKLLEKLVANRISKATEQHNLLPEEQMGARPHRSTVSAVGLLTEQIHTIWGKDKKRAASILSLDISGAFDNVSHERLIHNMRIKGIPQWITNFTASFLERRTTSVVLGSFRGDKITTTTGIPQGSPLSPILFLFFASTLLPMLRTESSSAVGFVDDTNILTWSNTTEENCRHLEQLHDKCMVWAKSHGVKFAPEKYQMMHFSRARKRHNLTAPMVIQTHIQKPQDSLRILGIQFDPKLNWDSHIKSINLKTAAHLQVMRRLTQSTWGANFQKSRLLYNALVRPALTYGSAVWSEAGPKGQIPERIVKPLRSLQRKCLKLITGAYNSTSSRVLEHETSTLPIEIYLKQRRIHHAGSCEKRPAQQTLKYAMENIKLSACGRNMVRDKNKRDDLAEWRKISEKEDNTRKQKEMLKIAAFQQWEQSWNQHAPKADVSHRAPADPETWHAATIITDNTTGKVRIKFTGTPFAIHQNLTRAQSSIATQIRSEHVGLNAYLYRRKVPGVDEPRCQCGYPSQNAKHMVMVCPQWAQGRGDVLRKARNRTYEAMMDSPEDVGRITKWIQAEGYIEQFRLTREVEAVVEERGQAKG